MIKSTLFYSVLLLFFLPGQLSAAPGLPATVVFDTIPPAERFDEPLSGAVRQQEEPKSGFQQRVADRMVIPVKTIETDTTYRSLREIPEGYRGYKIELMSTSIPLPTGHDLFFQHGNITLEELDGTSFSYLIGHFEEKEKAEAFREAFLKDRYPDSKVVGYLEGQRQSKPTTKAE